MKARKADLSPMADYEKKAQKTFWNRFWDLFYSNDAPSYYNIGEREYEKAVAIIEEETREYIARIRNSSAVSEIVSSILKKGVPERFEVLESCIFWSYPGENLYANSISFDKLGLCHLSRRHNFSENLPSHIWIERDANDRSYFGRFLESIQHGGSFYQKNPDLFGIDMYYPDPLNSHNYRRLCLNEPVIVGIVISQKMNVLYSYNEKAEFKRYYPTTKAW